VASSRDEILKRYEQEPEGIAGRRDSLFTIAVICSFLLFGAIGMYLRTHNPPPQAMEEKLARTRQVTFVIEERKKPVMEQPKPVQTPPKPVEPEPVPKEPIDLTNKPLLNQEVEEPKPDNTKAETEEPVRRVYGLRKVYSTGIGAGSDASQAVIGKLGNTLAAPIDTFVATKEELKGRVVPASRVQSYPKRKNEVKPEYTREMLDNHVEGVVKANILIDADGRVKKVVVLNDLGYGTKKKVYEACLKLRFEPARMDGKPVAVWFGISFRFEITE
jgi:protein TonB